MKNKGSITVFAALAIMLVAQLLFTLLEAARHREFEKVLKMNTDSVLESAFADYCTPLWENYRLLGMTSADTQGNFTFNNREAALQNLTKENLGGKGHSTRLSGITLLSADMVDIEFEPYLLMTDQGGRVFEQAVCSYMKKNLPYEMAKSIYNDYEAVKAIKSTYGGNHGEVDGVPPTMIKASSAAGGQDNKDAVPIEENPIETVNEAKRDGVLSLVLPDNAKISGSKLEKEKTVSHRKLQKGTQNEAGKDNWYQKVLLNQYFVNYLSCYTAQKENHVMKYEMEYLISGKMTDSDNLKMAAGKLLAVRESFNFAMLMASGDKQAEAYEMALILAGATANPAVIEAIKIAILISWAYVESVLDVRTLLAGGKISFMKNDVEWTSNLYEIPSLLSGWSQAKNCSQGIDYQQYLALLLLFYNGEKLSMRAMDVEEVTVRSISGYENFQMDHVVCECQIKATYEYTPLFLRFVNLLKKKEDFFQIRNQSQYSYFSGKEEGV